MGFEKTMNAIIENLPSERQTLLFSATQTKYENNRLKNKLENNCNESEFLYFLIGDIKFPH